MNPTENGVYRFLTVFSNCFLLNILWLLFSLPVVTAYPATSAMFAVTREWSNDNDPNLLRAFIVYFRENFWRSIWVGLVWTILGIVLVLNLLLVINMLGLARIPLFLAFSAAIVLYMGSSVYIFPVIVTYDVSWPVVIKNSVLLAASQLPITAMGLFILTLSLSLFLLLPAILLMSGSLTAYFITRQCAKSFRRVEAAQNER